MPSATHVWKNVDCLCRTVLPQDSQFKSRMMKYVYIYMICMSNLIETNRIRMGQSQREWKPLVKTEIIVRVDGNMIRLDISKLSRSKMHIRSTLRG